jgi:hypothetical protein
MVVPVEFLKTPPGFPDIDLQSRNGCKKGEWICSWSKDPASNYEWPFAVPMTSYRHTHSTAILLPNQLAVGPDSPLCVWASAGGDAADAIDPFWGHGNSTAEQRDRCMHLIALAAIAPGASILFIYGILYWRALRYIRKERVQMLDTWPPNRKYPHQWAMENGYLPKGSRCPPDAVLKFFVPMWLDQQVLLPFGVENPPRPLPGQPTVLSPAGKKPLLLVGAPSVTPQKANTVATRTAPPSCTSSSSPSVSEPPRLRESAFEGMGTEWMRSPDFKLHPGIPACVVAFPETQTLQSHYGELRWNHASRTRRGGGFDVIAAPLRLCCVMPTGIEPSVPPLQVHVVAFEGDATILQAVLSGRGQGCLRANVSADSAAVTPSIMRSLCKNKLMGARHYWRCPIGVVMEIPTDIIVFAVAVVRMGDQRVVNGMDVKYTRATMVAEDELQWNNSPRILQLRADHAETSTALSVLQRSAGDLKCVADTTATDLRARNTDLSDMASTHDQELAGIRTAHTTFLTELSETHITALTGMRTAHDDEISGMRTAHEAQISDMRTAHEAQISGIHVSHVAEVATVHRSSGETLASLRTAHQTSFENLNETHRLEISDIRLEISDINGRLLTATTSADEGRSAIDRCNIAERELARLQVEMTNLRACHTEKMAAVKTRASKGFQGLMQGMLDED